MRDRSILEPTFEEYIIPRDFKKNPIRVGGVCGVATNDAIAHYTKDANHLGVFDQRIVTALEGRISSLQTDISNNRETLTLH